ncbi:MAG: hypothetical protein PHX41_14005 [Kiritimatiellae bacterium]|nr:hypothetical protein [Kiritimatiellia bacterium]
MTRAKRIPIPVLLTASAVASVCICSAGETVQPASLRHSERETAEQQSALLENKSHDFRYEDGAPSYKMVTGKQADYTDLVDSLRSPKATGRFMLNPNFFAAPLWLESDDGPNRLVYRL